MWARQLSAAALVSCSSPEVGRVVRCRRCSSSNSRVLSSVRTSSRWNATRPREQGLHRDVVLHALAAPEGDSRRRLDVDAFLAMTTWQLRPVAQRGGATNRDAVERGAVRPNEAEGSVIQDPRSHTALVHHPMILSPCTDVDTSSKESIRASGSEQLFPSRRRRGSPASQFIANSPSTPPDLAKPLLSIHAGASSSQGFFLITIPNLPHPIIHESHPTRPLRSVA